MWSTVFLCDPDKIPNNSMRIVMESEPRKRPAAPHDGSLPLKKPWFDKWVVKSKQFTRVVVCCCWVSPPSAQTQLQQDQPSGLPQESPVLPQRKAAGSADPPRAQQHQQTQRALQQVRHHRQPAGQFLCPGGAGGGVKQTAGFYDVNSWGRDETTERLREQTRIYWNKTPI